MKLLRQNESSLSTLLKVVSFIHNHSPVGSDGCVQLSGRVARSNARCPLRLLQSYEKILKRSLETQEKQVGVNTLAMWWKFIGVVVDKEIFNFIIESSSVAVSHYSHALTLSMSTSPSDVPGSMSTGLVSALKISEDCSDIFNIMRNVSEMHGVRVIVSHGWENEVRFGGFI